MSRRNKYKLEKFKLYMRKNIFGMKFPVRNLLVMMVVFTVIFMSVIAVDSLNNAKNGDKVNTDVTAVGAVGAAGTKEAVKDTAQKSAAADQNTQSKEDAAKADKAVKVNKSAVDHVTVSESKYDMTGKFIVTADELNIRSAANVEGDVIGTLYKDYFGEVVKVEGEWTEIKSGEVSGFVKSEYILTNDKASEYITSIGGLEKANYAVAAAKEDETTDADQEETDDQDETSEDQTDDTDDSDDYDEDSEDYDESDDYDDDSEDETTEEVTEEEITTTEEETTEEVTEVTTTEEVTEEPTTEATTAEPHEQYSGDTRVHAAGGFSEDDVRLLAAIVYAESGCESYEGQVAVANVVLNRLYSGRWGGTLHDVIYAPYQFTATDTWAFSDVYANGAPELTMSAVYDALNGYNNIGGYMSFRPTWYMDPSELDDCTVIGNHVFF